MRRCFLASVFYPAILTHWTVEFVREGLLHHAPNSAARVALHIPLMPLAFVEEHCVRQPHVGFLDRALDLSDVFFRHLPITGFKLVVLELFTHCFCMLVQSFSILWGLIFRSIRVKIIGSMTNQLINARMTRGIATTFPPIFARLKYKFVVDNRATAIKPYSAIFGLPQIMFL